MKVFQLLLRICICFILFYGLQGCDSGQQSRDRIIGGTIQGLPDGVMYLQDYSFSKIDSCFTTNGKFEFLVTSDKFPEPVYAKMFHITSKDSTMRFFHFPTKHKINGYPVAQDLFMLDQEGITMNGKIKDSFFDRKKASSSIDGVVKFGKQTNTFLADTFNFYGRLKVKDIEKLILGSPYSYHFLYSIKKNMHVLSDAQLLSLLKCFDEDVLASNTASEMKNYVTSRSQMRLYNTSFTDSTGKQDLVLEQKAKLNMVILWASWCGPCREEIPQLKEIYNKFGDNQNFKMVSVSLDRENLKWKKVLETENMPWKQLLVDGKKVDYYKDLFNVNSSIPTTLFYDANGRLLKKYIGFKAENDTEIMNLIAANIK